MEMQCFCGFVGRVWIPSSRILRHESSEVVGGRKMTKDRLLIKMQKSAKISVEQLISE